MKIIPYFLLLMTLISIKAIAATPPPAPTNTNACPKGYVCCPDMSNTMAVDLTQWQVTGQPLPNNTLEMVWWQPLISDSPNPKGYITCYYNAQAPHPYTLQSIAPALKPQKGTHKWQTGKIRDLECNSGQISDCPFQPDTY